MDNSEEPTSGSPGQDADDSGGKNGEDTEGGIDAGDIDADTDADADGDADGDMDTDSVEDSDAGDESTGIEDEYAHLETHIFVSAPDADGWVTVAALPGTVPAGRTVDCFVAGTDIDVPVGLERGFAVRAAAAVGDILNIAVRNEDTTFAILSTTIQGNDTPMNWSGMIGSAGVTFLDGSFLSIAGNGTLLTPEQRVAGANITRSSAVIAPVWCDDAGCFFEFILPGSLTDEIDLFLVPNDSRLGTASGTMPVP